MVFEPGRVAKDYVKSWFIVDLLSVIPFDRVSTPRALSARGCAYSEYPCEYSEYPV